MYTGVVFVGFPLAVLTSHFQDLLERLMNKLNVEKQDMKYINEASDETERNQRIESLRHFYDSLDHKSSIFITTPSNERFIVNQEITSPMKSIVKNFSLRREKSSRRRHHNNYGESEFGSILDHSLSRRADSDTPEYVHDFTKQSSHLEIIGIDNNQILDDSGHSHTKKGGISNSTPKLVTKNDTKIEHLKSYDKSYENKLSGNFSFMNVKLDKIMETCVEPCFDEKSETIPSATKDPTQTPVSTRNPHNCCSTNQTNDESLFLKESDKLSTNLDIKTTTKDTMPSAILDKQTETSIQPINQENSNSNDQTTEETQTKNLHERRRSTSFLVTHHDYKEAEAQNTESSPSIRLSRLSLQAKQKEFQMPTTKSYSLRLLKDQPMDLEACQNANLPEYKSLSPKSLQGYTRSYSGRPSYRPASLNNSYRPFSDGQFHTPIKSNQTKIQFIHADSYIDVVHSYSSRSLKPKQQQKEDLTIPVNNNKDINININIINADDDDETKSPSDHFNHHKEPKIPFMSLTNFTYYDGTRESLVDLAADIYELFDCNFDRYVD